MALEYLREYRTYFDWLARVSCYRNIRWIEDTLIFALPGKKVAVAGIKQLSGSKFLRHLQKKQIMNTQ